MIKNRGFRYNYLPEGHAIGIRGGGTFALNNPSQFPEGEYSQTSSHTGFFHRLPLLLSVNPRGQSCGPTMAQPIDLVLQFEFESQRERSMQHVTGYKVVTQQHPSRSGQASRHTCSPRPQDLRHMASLLAEGILHAGEVEEADFIRIPPISCFRSRPRQRQFGLHHGNILPINHS